MTDQQHAHRLAHALRLAQALRELDQIADELAAKAANLQELGDRGEWPHDLQTYARRVASTRDYLRELEP